MPAVIRLAGPQDGEPIQAIYAPIVRDTPISFEMEPPTVSEMQQRIDQTLARLPWIVCELAGELLGYAYAATHRTRAAYQWSVDVSVYVSPRARRAGVGRALYGSLFQLLILQGFYNAYAGITLPNPASVGLHEAMGFRPLGVYRKVGFKQGAWHDVGWWHYLLQEHTTPPEPPANIGTIRGTPAWDGALASGVSLLRP